MYTLCPSLCHFFHVADRFASPMNLVTGLWGMNVHVPGQDIEEGVSPILRVEHIANESITQYTWFGGILGCLCLFAVLGAWATVSRIFLA